MVTPRAGRPRTVLETPFVKIYQVDLRLGRERRVYTVSEFGERVGVLLFRGADVALVRQYRLLARAWTWEIPGGKIEAGETPERAARREVAEETGWRCGRLEKLVTYMPGLDVIDNRTHVFAGKALDRRGAAKPGETRGLRWVPFERCLRDARRGRQVDGLTVAAVLAWRAFHPEEGPCRND